MDFSGMTTSNTFKVKDAAAFWAAIKAIRFGGDVNITVADPQVPHNALRIIGEDTFMAYAADEEEGEPDYRQERLNEFLTVLKNHLAAGEHAVIQSIGHEGLRFPFHGVAFVVTPDAPIQETILPFE